MVEDRRLVDYLRFHYLAENDPEILKSLIQNPSETLERLGLNDEAIRSPPEVLQALDRARELTKNMENQNVTAIDELPRVVKLVEDVFGKDFKVSKEPFGIRFSENVKGIGTSRAREMTATGTVSGTFGSFDNLRPDADF